MSKEEKFGLRQFANRYGLKAEKDCCSGNYSGYRIHVRYHPLGNPACLLTIVTNTAGKKKELEKYLERHKKELKLSAFGVVGIGLMVSPQVYTKVFQNIEEILDKLIAYLKKNGFTSAEHCPYCGKPMDEDRTEMLESGIPFAAHEACFAQAFSAAQNKEEEERRRPDRRMRGIVGALLGSLASVAALFVMFLWWEFGAIAALLGTIFGGWLYGKFGGKNTIFRIVFVSACSLILLLIAYFLCLYMQAPASDSATAVLAHILEQMRQDVYYRAMFVLNLVFLGVFNAVGTAYNCILYRRDRTKIYSLVKRANVEETNYAD